MHKLMIDAVFEGGGIQVVAYVGALRALEEKNIQIRKIAAVSSASFPVLGIIVGRSVDEIEDIMFETDFSQFAGPILSEIHREAWFSFINKLRLFHKLGTLKGFDDGQAIIDWICNTVLKGVNPHITFKDLLKDLRVIAYDYTHDSELVFSRDTTPDTEVVTAIRASAALIPIFQPARWTDEKGDIHLLTDGGVINAFPVEIFDNEKTWNGLPPTLGFKLIEEKRPHSLDEDFFIYLMYHVSRAIRNQDRLYRKPRHRRKTIYIPIGIIRSIDFLSIGNDKEVKQKLLDAGYQATKNWLDQYGSLLFLPEPLFSMGFGLKRFFSSSPPQ